ncbi:hypothetical protein C8R45DRAFT_920271 [Mycena sanguinolenta]|nr:hypothetical protein C8R45DRAFT_920271 [Mycena sanguinolenta]
MCKAVTPDFPEIRRAKMMPVKDIELNGIPIPNIEHADDILTASEAPPGFQSHLNGAQSWANNNGCETTSIAKCLYQIFGPRQKHYPSFNLGGNTIKQVQKACYLGIWLETGAKFIWREHYKVKAKKATTVANVILSLDRFVGHLPAWDARTLYMARVDPYLTSGCDVCLDVDLKSLKLLEKVQLSFLRLYVPVDLNIQRELDVATVEIAMREVKKSMEVWIVMKLNLHRGVKQPEHRKALTKMVLSSHSLAVERRRWKERGKNIVPHQWRLCRFCYIYVEDPVHAMFQCKHGQFTEPLQFFRALLPRREVTPFLQNWHATHKAVVLKFCSDEPKLSSSSLAQYHHSISGSKLFCASITIPSQESRPVEPQSWYDGDSCRASKTERKKNAVVAIAKAIVFRKILRWKHTFYQKPLSKAPW